MSKSIQQSKNSNDDVMTVERLRKHLFGGPQVPFWNYDPAQLTIGIEVEYFIAHVHEDGSFKLATKDEYLQVMEHLKRDWGYKDRNLHDQPGRVSRDTELGYISIKPDFAWHILEFSFPPRKSIEALKSMIESSFHEVDLALKKLNLVRLDISSLTEVPKEMDLVALDRLGQITSTLRPSQEFADATSVFPALITATHIHLNVLKELDLAHLDKLYKIDEIVSSRFTRPTFFNGKKYENLRKMLYQEGFGREYLLHTVPTKIPSNLEDFCALFNESRKVFPGDRFFPVRDMTFIRPTRYGTLEFRSSCSFKSIDRLLELVQWRIAQVLTAFDQSQLKSIKSNDLNKALNQIELYLGSAS